MSTNNLEYNDLPKDIIKMFSNHALAREEKIQICEDQNWNLDRIRNVLIEMEDAGPLLLDWIE